MRFLKGFSITLVSQGIVQLAGFINGIIIARNLGPSGRGEYAMIIFLMTMLLVVLGEGMYRSNVYLVSRNKTDENLKTVSSDIIGFAVMVLVLIGLLALMPISWLQAALPGVDQPISILVLPLLCSSFCCGSFRGYTRAYSNFGITTFSSHRPFYSFCYSM